MERLFSGGGASRSGKYLDTDKNKKPFNYNNKRHHKPFQSASNSWFRRLTTPAKGILILIAFSVLLLFFSITGQREKTKIQLRDQPTYKKHGTSCSVKLCNPLKKCSTWIPNKRYSWSDFSQSGVFRDLSRIEVNTGCNLRIKVEGGFDESHWLTIPEGMTECTETGYGTDCRNFVEMELTADILIMATQLKAKMNERVNEGEEIVIVQHPRETTTNTLDVTLISQFSVNRLETFARAIEAWPGPISVAIYLTKATDIDELIEYFEIEKNMETYSRVTLTLVKPNYHASDHLAYPINHLRNLAITESSTDYIFVMDADFAPSINLYPYVRNRLIPFILYQGDSLPSTAWVVPCFAIREVFQDLPIPTSYDELRKMIGNNMAYITDPGAGHGPTLATEIAIVRPLLLGDPLAYEVCYESQWEPYYILHRSAPLYDVRFRNQGGDKQSHALQLNAEKYRFMVLREVFMVHKDHPQMGWPDGGFEKAQKAAKKWSYFGEFMREIESLYGSNPRWPRGCSATAIGWQDQRRDTIGLAAGAA